MSAVLLVLAVVAVVWAKIALKRARARRAAVRRARASQPGKRYLRRAARWALHRMFVRRFTYRESGPVAFADPAPVARPGLIRMIRIRLAQHMVIAGLTGSGKSSTMRVLAAHVLRCRDASLEFWDLGFGAPESEHYRGRARLVTTVADVMDRIRALSADPARDGSHLVVMVDESAALFRQLTDRQTGELATLIEQARKHRLWFWFGVQLASRENLPTVIQQNASMTIGHRVASWRESQAVFDDGAWHAEQLARPGECLIKDGKRKPEPLRALWLGEREFGAMTPARPLDLSYAPPASPEPVTAPVPLIKVPAPVEKAVTLSDQQTLVCQALDMSERPLTQGELSLATGLNQNRVSDAVRALAKRGVAVPVADTYPATYVLVREDA